MLSAYIWCWGAAVVRGGILPGPNRRHYHQDHHCGHISAPQWHQSAGGWRPEHGFGCPKEERLVQGDHEVDSHGRDRGHVFPFPASPYQALVLVWEDVYHGHSGTGGAVPDVLPSGG